VPDSPSSAKLVFVHGFSERDSAEARDRGYLSHVLVEIDGVRLYPVLFYDPVRLQQDLEEGLKHDRSFLAEPGMIVLPDVTLDAMQDAVQRLCREGYFDYLVPLSREKLADADPYQWPP
jgi:hypothetical protein